MAPPATIKSLKTMSPKSQQTLTASSATLLRVMTLLTKHEGLTTLSSVQVFLLIARREGGEGMLVRDLVRATGKTQSAIARIVGALANSPQRGAREGLHWVEHRPDSEDPRKVRIFTTAKGQQVLADLDAIMQ